MGNRWLHSKKIIRWVFTLNVAFLLLMLVTTSTHVSAGGKSMDDLPANNIVLFYFIPGDPVTPEHYTPYVAYLDVAECPRAWFFDGFIYTTQFAYQHAADWADAMFAPESHFASLDAAIRQVSIQLGEAPPERRKLYLALPLMSGTVEERIERNRLFIDKTRRLWADNQYEHLELAGYYWPHEGVRDQPSYETIGWTHEYLSSLVGSQPWEREDLKLLIIPYDFGHPNRAQVIEFGEGRLPVDALWLQPNYLWADREKGYDRQDLDEVARFALSHGAPVEMEFDPGVFRSGWKTSRYYHYMDSGVTYGYMHLPLTYYQDRWGYAETARNPLPLMRQLYEDTFAFTQGFYRPRSVIHEVPLPTQDSAATEYFTRFRNLGDAFMPQGVWLGRRQTPEAVSFLRLIEPDPNQSHLLMLTFRTPESNGQMHEGIITIQTMDGEIVEVGRYPLDGELVTRWYPIAGSVLRQGVPRNPKDVRLVYPIQFSIPIELKGGWMRSDQHIMEWEATTGSKWASIDPESYNGRQGRSMPGVHWDEAAGRIEWFGLDGQRSYILGIETSESAVTYHLNSKVIQSDGSGHFVVPDLGANDRILRIWLQATDLPFHTAFGAQGDTAFSVRNPGITIVPGDAWHFVGQAVGMTRHLAGQGSFQVAVPHDDRQYVLRVSIHDGARLTWQLHGQDAQGPLVDEGTVTEEITEITLPGSGAYEVVWNGAGTFLEAWLEAVE